MAYDWQRIWIPRDIGGSRGIEANDRARAFEAPWQLDGAEAGVTLRQLRHVPCLVLLGEPGMGKTYTTRQEYHEVERQQAAMHVDLQGSASSREVRKRLFKSDRFRNWKNGQHKLTMFVDSVDRCQLPPSDVIGVISNQLGDCNPQRLQMRLVCRDYDWSAHLADTLRGHWNEDANGASQVQVYQLARLNHRDIEQAAVANRRNPDAFLQRVRAAGALPLAEIPITLNMLLETDEITSSRVELYRSGIRRLCAELDAHRRHRRNSEDARQMTEYEIDARYQTASRIAFFMVLSNCDQVEVSAPDAHLESTRAVRDLLLDKESEAEERMVRSVLDSALFTGTHKRSWSHQSFGEFLAASACDNNQMPIDDVLGKMQTPSKRFAPQLNETLRWLIDMRQDVVARIAQLQPELLLTADLSQIHRFHLRYFYWKMLNLKDEFIYADQMWQLPEFHASHPRANKILRKYAEDKERSIHVRCFVIRLMKSHGFTDMDDLLTSLARDKHEDYRLRRWATRALVQNGSDEAKLALKPLIYVSEHDPDDELKAYALEALWPNLLSAEELFSALHPPKCQNLTGSYRRFLFDFQRLEGLRVQDIPVALRWVESQPQSHNQSRAMEEIFASIMRKAWENRRLPGVMDALARAAVQMMLRGEVVFGGARNASRNREAISAAQNSFQQDAESRRRIIEIMLPAWRENQTDASSLLWGYQPLLFPSDIDWLLDMLDDADDDADRTLLAEFVADLSRQIGGGHATSSEPYRLLEQVYFASQQHDELKAQTVKLFQTRLDDPNTQVARRTHRLLNRRAEPANPIDEGPDPFEVINAGLDKVEAGESIAWLEVIHGLLLSRDSKHRWHDCDIMDYPNWKNCDDATRARIVRAAACYVRDFAYGDILRPTDNWFLSNGFASDPDLAGYNAMFLLLKEEPDILATLPRGRWEMWSKVIAWFHLNLASESAAGRQVYMAEKREWQGKLLRKLYQHVPDLTLKLLTALIEAEDKTARSLSSELQKVECIWDGSVEEALIGLLRDSSLSTKSQRAILDRLLQHECAEAVSLAEEFINCPSLTEDDQARQISFAVSLLRNSIAFDWQVIRRAFQSDDDFGKGVVKALSQARNKPDLSKHLSARDLGDLIKFVEDRYPSHEDPPFDDPDTNSTRGMVGQWRGTLINQLRSMDSREAREAFQRLCRQFPDHYFLNNQRVDIEKSVAGKDWQPSSPPEILDLIAIANQERPSKRDIVSGFLKKHWKWLIGMAARFLPFFTV